MQAVDEQRQDIEQEEREYAGQGPAGNPFQLLAEDAAGGAQIAAQKDGGRGQEVKSQIDVFDLIQKMFVGDRGHEIQHLRGDADVQQQQARRESVSGQQFGEQAPAPLGKNQGEMHQQGRLQQQANYVAPVDGLVKPIE